ncbi:MAG: CDP-6-deoxy-delta-3,4-glucoseen reductase [Cocleimonas sp.]|nr:CDP-6-deoxy-delta-3,4-glucoseen reductase [Cocleimonas sp.]
MSFEITVRSGGHHFIAEEGELILDAALRQGISFPYGCRSGVCGNCLGTVVAGSVEYPKGLPLSLMEDEQAQGKALFCSAVATSSLEIKVRELESVADIEAKTLPARVVSLRKLSTDVMEMTLKLPETERFQFKAGQYLEFLLRNGKRRAFSIANAPHNNHYLELHLRLVEGGYFTSHVFNEMKEKALVRLHGALGTFFIREDNQTPLILIAGGTGFAPIKSIIEHLIETGDSRDIYFYWGARAKADLYYDALPRKWAAYYKHIHYIPVLSDPQTKDQWQGRTGFVHQAVAEDFKTLSNSAVYMAGPPPMVDAAKTLCHQRGLNDDQIFSDAFDFSQN